MTDRGLWVAGLDVGGNVRRLMYQSLIWAFDLGNDARRLRAALDAKDSKGLPDPLVDGVRRNMELGRDFLGAEVLVDEEQAVELTGCQPGDARGHYVRRAQVMGLTRRSMRIV